MSEPVPQMIRRIRENSGLSQAELARRAGIPRSVMNLYEHGKREPSAEMLARLLRAGGYRMVAEPIDPPVDPDRAGRILEQVIGLAEALPFRPAQENRYPPLVRTLAQTA